MKSAIKAVNSSLSLILTVFELFVSVAFLLKLFGSSLDSESNLIDCVSWIIGSSNEGQLFFVESSDLAGPVSFLILILGFMFFSLALFKLAPYMLRKQEDEN